MKNSDLKKGITVWVKIWGRWSRVRQAEVVPTQITSVGLRYFYLKEFPGVKFEISSGLDLSDTTHNAMVFLSKEKYEEHEEYRNIGREVCDFFRNVSSYQAIPLSKWKKIQEILNAG